MIRIQTLGGLSVRGDDGQALSGAAAQPRRVAVLALLARAGARGVSRETLLALLWPDASEDRARNTLAQAVYSLRRDLKSEAAIVGAKELCLDPDVVTSDVAEFSAAVSRGGDARAAELYGGPFLYGFHLAGAEEFERWAEGERDALARDYARSLEALARGALTRGDATASVAWWRKLAALDPLNARVTVGLMEALAASGDRAGALGQARIYELLLEQELDLPPDSAVAALSARLRREAESAAIIVERAEHAAPAEVAEPTITPPALPSAALLAMPDASAVPGSAAGVAPEVVTAVSAPPPAVAAGETRSGRGPRQPPRHWTGWAAALALVVAVGSGVAALGMALRRPQAPAASVPVALRQITFSGAARYPAVSPDGRWVAYVANGVSLVVQELGPGGGGPQDLAAASQSLEKPRWSPDGSSIAFNMVRDSGPSSGLFVVARRGGPARRVAPDIQPFAWDPSGRSLVRAFGDTLTVVDVATGRVEAIVPLAPRSVTFGNDVAVSPDGRWIALGLQSEFGVLSRDGRTWRRLGGGAIHQVRWSRRGDALYFLNPAAAGADLMRVRIDGRTGAPVGEPALVFSGLKQGTRLDLTPDGRTLVFDQAPVNDQLWTMSVAGPRERLTATATATQSTSGSLERARADLTADGEWVAFSQRDEGTSGSYSYNIHVAPFAGGPSRAIVATAAQESYPRWAPDGRRLAYLVRDSSGLSVMVWDQATGRVERVEGGIAAPPVYFKPLAWSGDGATLVYPADGGHTLTAVRLAGGVRTSLPRPDSSGSFVGWAVSPDGGEVVAARMAGTSDWFTLWRMRLGEGAWQRIDGPNGDAVPLRWTDDGWLYLWVDYADDRLPEVWRMRADGGRPQLYLRLPVECRKSDLALSRDARRLACVVSTTSRDIWQASNLDAQAR